MTAMKNQPYFYTLAMNNPKTKSEKANSFAVAFKEPGA